MLLLFSWAPKGSGRTVHCHVNWGWHKMKSQWFCCHGCEGQRVWQDGEGGGLEIWEAGSSLTKEGASILFMWVTTGSEAMGVSRHSCHVWGSWKLYSSALVLTPVVETMESWARLVLLLVLHAQIAAPWNWASLYLRSWRWSVLDCDSAQLQSKEIHAKVVEEGATRGILAL